MLKSIKKIIWIAAISVVPLYASYEEAFADIIKISQSILPSSDPRYFKLDPMSGVTSQGYTICLDRKKGTFMDTPFGRIRLASWLPGKSLVTNSLVVCCTKLVDIDGRSVYTVDKIGNKKSVVPAYKENITPSDVQLAKHKWGLEHRRFSLQKAKL